MSTPKDLGHFAFLVGPPYPIVILSFSIQTLSNACREWLAGQELFRDDGDDARVELAGVDGTFEEHHARMLSFAQGNIVNLALCSIEQLYRYLDIVTIWGTLEDREGIQRIITANTSVPDSGEAVPMIAHFKQAPAWSGCEYERDVTRAEELAKLGAGVEEVFLTVCHAWFEPPGPSPFSARAAEERAVVVTATMGQLALYLSQHYLVCMILPLAAWERTGRGQVIRHVMLIGERTNEGEET